MENNDNESGNSMSDGRRQYGSWFGRYIGWPTAVALCVILYVAFFGENSITRRMEYERTIDSLSVCLARQQDSLRYYKDMNSRLSRDPVLMEKVVREQYNMNRPNEDVFVVEVEK